MQFKVGDKVVYPNHGVGVVEQIMTASQQRIELIARVFAETGVKDLFWMILELTQKHSSKPEVIRLNNQFVTVDPREWSNKFDMTVSVGLGTGSKERSLQTLQSVMQMQGAALQAGLPIVQPINIYNAAVEYCKAAELKGSDLFFTNPTQVPPQQPQPDPALEKAKIDAQVKLKTAEDKNKLAVWKTQYQADTKKEVAEIQHGHASDQAALDRMHETNKHGADLVQEAMNREHDLNLAKLAKAMSTMGQPEANGQQ